MSGAMIARAVLALTVGASTLAGCRRASAPQATTFELNDAWVRATPDSGATTAAYIRFVNGSPDTVVVSRFSSDAARMVELHQSSADAANESHMAMRASLVIAPAHSVVMHPGGYHLMLLGTTRSLLPGRLVRIVMHLSDGAIVATSARVKP